MGIEVRRRNKKFSGYESDGHSVASEVVPMQSYRREFSRSQSLQLAPGGKDELSYAKMSSLLGGPGKA